MTEKRFTLVLDEDYGDVLNDNITGDAYGFEREYRISIVELLNMLHEENQELKHDNKRLVKFIMSKGYTLKDYLDWLKEVMWND